MLYSKKAARKSRHVLIHIDHIIEDEISSGTARQSLALPAPVERELPLFHRGRARCGVAMGFIAGIHVIDSHTRASPVSQRRTSIGIITTDHTYKGIIIHRTPCRSAVRE